MIIIRFEICPSSASGRRGRTATKIHGSTTRDEKLAELIHLRTCANTSGTQPCAYVYIHALIMHSRNACKPGGVQPCETIICMHVIHSSLHEDSMQRNPVKRPIIQGRGPWLHACASVPGASTRHGPREAARPKVTR